MSNAQDNGDQALAGSKPLRLRALNADGLQTIAACLQDALVPLSEIAFLKAEQRFVMVANRFRWEHMPAETPPALEPATDARFAEHENEEGVAPCYERVNCGICFDGVRAVKFKDLDMRRKGQILNLLTMQSRPDAISLIFAGGAIIRLETGSIRCHMEDLGEPWPTQWQPMHEAADGDPPGGP